MADKKDILTYFPHHLKPRDVQKNCLLEISRVWDKAEIIVVNLPVASGKSAISMTVARWAKTASIITPSKLLVNQYKDEYTNVHVLRGKSDYWCATFDCVLTKRPKGKKIPTLCPPTLYCDGCNTYRSDLRKARVMPYLLSNYYTYMAHKLYRPVLIADEAHQLISVLKSMARKSLWWNKYKFPTKIKTRAEIKSWAESLTEYQKQNDFSIRGLLEELNSKFPRYLVGRDTDRFRGEDDERIYLEPVDIRDEPPFMWPSSVGKILLLSATISRKDIEQMGLGGKRIAYIEADSPINAENRPVIIPRESVSLSFNQQEVNLPKIAEYIKNCAAHHSEDKGLIHITYGLAEKLRTILGADSRFIWHDKENKMAQYKKFRESEEPVILVASGMYEGIDLPYDSGRWQVVAKVPWPSLAEPAIKYLLSQDKEYYAWETIKTTLQACGRICRTPEDFGVTYIVDSTFKRLYNDNPTLFPLWFKNSVSIEGGDDDD